MNHFFVIVAIFVSFWMQAAIADTPKSDSACQFSGVEFSGSKKSRSREKDFQSAPEFRRLIDLRDELFSRVKRADLNTLKSAYQSGSQQNIAAALGLSEAELTNMDKQLFVAARTLVRKFPELEDIMAERAPTMLLKARDAYIEEAIEIVNAAQKTFASGILKDTDYQIQDSGVSCRYFPYTASLTLCTATGPTLYWACAALATCEFCSGGWVDDVCG